MNDGANVSLFKIVVFNQSFKMLSYIRKRFSKSAKKHECFQLESIITKLLLSKAKRCASLITFPPFSDGHIQTSQR
jgi:hypothetical protein